MEKNKRLSLQLQVTCNPKRNMHSNYHMFKGEWHWALKSFFKKYLFFSFSSRHPKTPQFLLSTILLNTSPIIIPQSPVIFPCQTKTGKKLWPVNDPVKARAYHSARGIFAIHCTTSILYVETEPSNYYKFVWYWKQILVKVWGLNQSTPQQWDQWSSTWVHGNSSRSEVNCQTCGSGERF